jgi:hypothetical protein
MKQRILTAAGLSLAVMLSLSAAYALTSALPPSAGQNLVGTWDVRLSVPVCSSACPCLPGVSPGTRLHALHTYSGDGTMEEVYGGSLLFFRSDALGSWEHASDQEYTARYKFYFFNSTTGERLGTEVVTSQINLQGKDAFEAAATFDLFEADGVTPVRTGCQLNITGTRF